MWITNKPEENCLVMKNNEKVLQLIGLSHRARLLISGSDTVLRSIRKQSVQLVLVANDAGATTKKKFLDKCEFYQIDVDMTFSKQQLGQASGQSNIVYGILDNGFAKKIKELLQM